MELTFEAVTVIASLLGTFVSIAVAIITLLSQKDSAERFKAISAKLYTFTPVFIFFFVSVLTWTVGNEGVSLLIILFLLIAASIISFHLFISKEGQPSRNEVATLVMYQAACLLFISFNITVYLLNFISSISVG